MKRTLVKEILLGMFPGMKLEDLKTLPEFREEIKYLGDERLPERIQLAEQASYEKLKNIVRGYNSNRLQKRKCGVCEHENFLSKVDLCYSCLEVFQRRYSESLKIK